MINRDRAEGWKHAKLTGHKNEELIKEMLDTNKEYSVNFLQRIGYNNYNLSFTSIGGLHETDVESVVPKSRKTKSKTDLKLFFEEGSQTNISIKKSLTGQVYLVGADIFINCFEIQFRKIIPENVKRAINLFWSSSDDAIEIIQNFGDSSSKKAFDMQIRHGSLNATTLYSYDINLYNSLLQWFK